MSHAGQKHWTIEEFLVWQEGRPGRYEFVGGEPVEDLNGRNWRHDGIVVNVVNVVALFRSLLRGTGFSPFTAGLCLETLPGRVRRPDVGVDCGARDPEALIVRRPIVVVEVSSPETRQLVWTVKLVEYKAVPSIRTILYVEPNRPEVYVFERSDDVNGGWQEESRVIGLDQEVAIPALGIVLPLAEIFDGIEFVPGPLLA